MRRLVIVVAILLVVVASLVGVGIVTAVRRSSLDAMLVAGATNVQIERESWARTRISYRLPSPAQGISRQIDTQLQREGWVLSGGSTIVASIYDPDPPPRHYFRIFGPHWIYESVFVRSFDSYGANPGNVRIVVLRSVHWPRLPGGYRLPFT